MQNKALSGQFVEVLIQVKGLE